MTPNLLTVAPGDLILKAASYMGLKNFRRIPVEENGNLAGMESSLRATMKEGYVYVLASRRNGTL